VGLGKVSKGGVVLVGEDAMRIAAAAVGEAGPPKLVGAAHGSAVGTSLVPILNGTVFFRAPSALNT
jgi:hypothetical protein